MFSGRITQRLLHGFDRLVPQKAHTKTPAHLRTGRRGEEDAYFYLRKNGYVMVARNYRSPKRHGEIDLIGWDKDVLCFIEVKTRTSHDAGHPADAVDEAKRRRLTRLALSYMKRHDLLECSARFDVVAVTWPARGRPTIEHFKSAFEATGFDGLFS